MTTISEQNSTNQQPASATKLPTAKPNGTLVPLQATDNSLAGLQTLIEPFREWANLNVPAPRSDRGSDIQSGTGLLAGANGDVLGSALSLGLALPIRQAFDLQKKLVRDITGSVLSPIGTSLTHAFCAASLEQLQRFQMVCKTKRDALRELQAVETTRLQLLVTLAGILFKKLLMTASTGTDSTLLDAAHLEMLRTAGIEIPDDLSPLALYTALCQQLLLQEQELISAGLQLLRSELEGTRLGIYSEAAEFVSVSPQVVAR